MAASHFPVSKSLLDATLLGPRIEAAYGLAEVRCTLLSAGRRDVYLVTAGTDRYTFTLYPTGRRNPDEVGGEWRFVAHLYQHGLPVVPAIPTLNDDILLRFVAPEGLRFAVLTRYAAGRSFVDRPAPFAAREYGRILARLAQLTDEREEETFDRPAQDPRLELNGWVEAFAAAFPDRPGNILFLQEAANALQTRLPALPKRKPFFGMVHGNAGHSNLQVTAGGDVTLLDFDQCGSGWRVYDMAAFLVDLHGDADEESLRAAFLEGYEAVRPLKRPEAEAIMLYAATRAIGEIGRASQLATLWGRARVLPDLDGAVERVEYYMERV